MQPKSLKLPHWAAAYLAAVVVILGTTGMHIPDGYLSPVTCIILYILVLPFWIVGYQQLRKTANARSIPLIALLAAFSFVIMMFNVPLPGGTTGHAVGAALAAIVLGPGLATISVSVALVIQALLFGDGGILAIGANCFTMAVVMPYVSFAVYNWLTRNARGNPGRRILGAGIAGYVGLSAAAFVTSVLFGIQPALFTSAGGVPLYAPYPLAIAIPAVMIPHLLVASVVEGVVTAAIIAYIQRALPQLLSLEAAPGQRMISRRWWRAPLVTLVVLVVITPLGLLAPGTAWGEWGAQELGTLGLGFIPEGLHKLGGLWGAPFRDYDIPALGNVSLSYLLSAFLGVLLTLLLTWLLIVLVRNTQRLHEKRPD
ncbi:MAG: cobalt transporter CbiM [Anaerolineae bacterium]